MTYDFPWIYNGTLFDSGDIGEYYGFIYRITNITNGHDYVGRKYFKTIKKRPPLKGKKNKRLETIETDWKDYWGSSSRLVADILELGKEQFKREIIHLCSSRGETNYMEAHYQFKEEVLLREDNYNGRRQLKLGKNSVKDVKINKTS